MIAMSRDRVAHFVCGIYTHWAELDKIVIIMNISMDILHSMCICIVIYKVQVYTAQIYTIENSVEFITNINNYNI